MTIALSGEVDVRFTVDNASNQRPEHVIEMDYRQMIEMHRMPMTRRSMRLTHRLTAALAVAFCLAAGTYSAIAHHSTTMFDHSKTLTLTGTVVELRWTNPHVTLLVKGTVEKDEEPSEWLLEMTSPGNLVRAGGWTRSAVKPGDQVVVEMSPLRDADKHGGALKKMTVVATGQVFTANLRAQEMPGLE
jgi:hypothetical protein